MSTARHVIALLKSYLEGEEQQFFSIALQMAAHEARQGHTKVAQEIQNLIDKARTPYRGAHGNVKRLWRHRPLLGWRNPPK
ncbi:hypothetical protein NIES22_53240 [Calothrix brevissima NIES-22]|nr:hypothetical protein NIES22_53240 [Calothrix brevissima NIES-22]